MPKAHMPPRIVTLDGPAGVGKSTLARRVAKELGIAYLDTGAMFRAIGLKAAQIPGVAGLLEQANGQTILQAVGDLAFALHGSGESTELWCNGHPLGQELRTENAGAQAARFAPVPEIRNLLKQAQQRLGSEFSLVAEGRDMGTEVFPAAPHKIFLDASVEVRGQRRHRQLLEMGQEADLLAITTAIAARDEQDRNRPVAPLKPAVDAVVIDTSHLTPDEVFAAIMAVVRNVRHVGANTTRFAR